MSTLAIVIVVVLAVVVLAEGIRLSLRRTRREMRGTRPPGARVGETAEPPREPERPRSAHDLVLDRLSDLIASKEILSAEAPTIESIVADVQRVAGRDFTPEQKTAFTKWLYEQLEFMEQRAAEERRARDRRLEERATEERGLFAELAEEPAAEERPSREQRPVWFHAHWPRSVPVGQWTTMLIYMYAGGRGYIAARVDFERRTRLPISAYDSGQAAASVERGTEITIIPDVPGVTFNPPYVRVAWLEEWQCVELRMQVPEDAERGRTFHGRIAFLVGPLAIADIAIDITVGQAEESEVELPLHRERFETPYRKIFVSYSHEDAAVVEALERAYKALGDSYLRDVNILRSGEPWSEALLALIPAADIFQLCWSTAARRSRYVEKEWRHAAELQRPHFIRPVYWERPMPAPPDELADIHFTFIPI